MMRVDSFLPVPYATDRSARTGRAADSYGETQRVAQAQRGVDSRSGQDYQPQADRPQQRVNSSALVERYSAFRYDEPQPERPLTSRVAQALASYASTASMSVEFDGAEVLGLDLYA